MFEFPVFNIFFSSVMTAESSRTATKWLLCQLACCVSLWRHNWCLTFSFLLCSLMFISMDLTIFSLFISRCVFCIRLLTDLKRRQTETNELFSDLTKMCFSFTLGFLCLVSICPCVLFKQVIIKAITGETSSINAQQSHLDVGLMELLELRLTDLHLLMKNRSQHEIDWERGWIICSKNGSRNILFYYALVGSLHTDTFDFNCLSYEIL